MVMLVLLVVSDTMISVHRPAMADLETKAKISDKLRFKNPLSG